VKEKSKLVHTDSRNGQDWSPSQSWNREYEAQGSLPNKTWKLQDQFSLNVNRKVIGTSRGYDAFLNVVLEESTNPEGENLGTVVIRGNSIIQFEGLERVQ